MDKYRSYVYLFIILGLLCANAPINALVIDVPADRPQFNRVLMRQEMEIRF